MLNKKYLCIPLIIVMAMLAAALFSGCGRTSADGQIAVTRSEDELRASFFAFDTYMTISVRTSDGGSGSISRKKLKEIAGEAARLEKLFSATDPEAEIYRINAGELDLRDASPEIKELLAFSADMYERTGGALDITAYPLVKAWGFTTGENRIPDEAEIRRLLERVGGRLVKDEADGSLILSGEGTEIDLGAVAKGYLSNRLAELLRNAGVEHALLDLGGNIVTIGTKPDGSEWKVGIRTPEDAFGIDASNSTVNPMIGYVSVHDSAVVTSGGYERCFADDEGNVYWHIIDPSTGYPARSGVISATVVGEDALLCDALSTALFVMGEERAREYYAANGGFEYILVLENGEIAASEGIGDSITYMK